MWHRFEDEKPRAGKWVIVVARNNFCRMACRQKGTDTMWYGKGLVLDSPLYWTEGPTADEIEDEITAAEAEEQTNTKELSDEEKYAIVPFEIIPRTASTKRAYTPRKKAKKKVTLKILGS